MNVKNRLLLACAALAAGEFAASQAPTLAEAWPAAALAAILAAAFGHALAVRGWPLAALALAGAALFLFAARDGERVFRERPWLREARPRRAAASALPALDPTRRDFSRRAALGIETDRETVSLNRAILLGERANLPAGLRRTFVESGTIHVFAISGLHVMAVARVLTTALQLLFVPRRLVGAAAVPILWWYVALIGFPPSAVRAAVMATLSCLAPLFRRRPDGVVAWSLTFLGVHLARPAMIANVGCALSFAVMLAILVACDRLRDSPEGLKKTLAVTVVAWAAGVPIAAHVFGRVTPGGILANLALIPAAVVTVYSGACGILASFASETLAAHLNALAALFTKAMVVISDGVSRLPGANVEVARWPVPVCAEWYAALGLAWLLHRLVTRRKSAWPPGKAEGGGSMV